MKNLIQCGTCGYPLTPEERGGLVEVDGVMVKPEQQEPVKFKCTVIDDKHPGGVPLERWGQQPAQPLTIEAAHGIKGDA